MELEKQVCSLELSKKFKELGVKQESAFYWGRNDVEGFREFEPDLMTSREVEDLGFDALRDGVMSAFTVAELGEMLPVYSDSERMNDKGQRMNKGAIWFCANDDFHQEVKHQYADTEADARAKMLIYLIENKIITL
jgi:hypothetical protein